MEKGDHLFISSELCHQRISPFLLKFSWNITSVVTLWVTCLSQWPENQGTRVSSPQWSPWLGWMTVVIPKIGAAINWKWEGARWTKRMELRGRTELSFMGIASHAVILPSVWNQLKRRGVSDRWQSTHKSITYKVDWRKQCAYVPYSWVIHAALKLNSTFPATDLPLVRGRTPW